MSIAIPGAKKSNKVRLEFDFLDISALKKISLNVKLRRIKLSINDLKNIIYESNEENHLLIRDILYFSCSRRPTDFILDPTLFFICISSNNECLKFLLKIGANPFMKIKNIDAHEFNIMSKSEQMVGTYRCPVECARILMKSKLAISDSVINDVTFLMKKERKNLDDFFNGKLEEQDKDFHIAFKFKNTNVFLFPEYF